MARNKFKFIFILFIYLLFVMSLFSKSLHRACKTMNHERYRLSDIFSRGFIFILACFFSFFLNSCHLYPFYQFLVYIVVVVVVFVVVIVVVVIIFVGRCCYDYALLRIDSYTRRAPIGRVIIHHSSFL